MNEHISIQTENLNNTDSNLKRKRKKGIIKKLIIIIPAVLLLLSIVLLSAIPPMIMNDMVNGHVGFKKTYAAQQFGIDSNKMNLKTTDGLNITAYEVFSNSPKAVVIFVSGIHNPSVTAFFGHAALLQKSGYASILCEMRAHGESDGDVICVGYKEYLDVKAVVNYIKTNDKYSNVPVVVYGLSMGGAVAINSIGEIPEIDGLISMSAYSSWEDVFCDNMANMGAPELFCAMEKPFVKLYCGLKYGFNYTGISPKKQIKKLGNRPALIYHSKGDSEVPYQSFERIINNASGKITTWTRNGDFHFPTEKFERPSEDIEYWKRIMDFLENNFANKVLKGAL